MPIKLYRRGQVFWLRGSVGGKRVHESTKTNIRSLAEEIRIDREKEIVQRGIYGEIIFATFSEATESYLETGGSARFLDPLNSYFGMKKLSAIRQREIDKAALTLYPNAAPATINRQLIGPVSAILNHASKRGLCDPVRFERRREPRGRTRFLWPDETEKFLAACAPHIEPIAMFLLGSGCRCSEALSLDWADVNLADGEAWIWKKVKTGCERRIEIPAKAVAALANIKHRSGRVFRTDKGEDYVIRDAGGGQIKEAMDGACERSSVARFTPHVLRHTWATWYYGTQKDVVRLMALGGWKKMEMVQRYVKLAPHDLGPKLLKHGWKFDPTPASEQKEKAAK